MRKNVPIHRPPHVYLDDTWYFLTASTVKRGRYLTADDHLRMWARILQELVGLFEITMDAWVVLPNHYHLLFKSRRGNDLGKFVGRLNGRTSHDLNQLDDARGRQVWYNYWETCIRTEADRWTRFNYVHNNPVKHGYV
jgi:putative transposase